jgi:hypothetical protein
MAITLNDNIQIAGGKLIDNKYGPYNSVSAALAALPAFIRARGLTVGVIENNALKEYWFKEGTNNSDLVEKITSGSSGGGGVGMDTGVRSLTGNWQSTYTTVQTNSASWGVGGGGMGSVPVIPDPLRFNFTGNGTTTNFTVSGTNNSNNPLYIDVYVDNVKQISSGVYSLSSEVVKFTDPPKVDSSVVIITPNYKNLGVVLNDFSNFTDEATIYL